MSELRNERKIPRAAIEIRNGSGESGKWSWLQPLYVPANIQQILRILQLKERHQTFSATNKTLLPFSESCQDRLHIRSVCGFKLPTKVYLLAAYEVFTWVIVCPLISLVVFLCTLYSKENELTDITPYIGLLFYTWIIPSMPLTILLFGEKIEFCLKADTPTLVIFYTIVSIICWVFAPVVGVYAMITQSASESESNTVLRIGAYLFLAIGLPAFSVSILLLLFWFLAESDLPNAWFGKHHNRIMLGGTGSIMVASAIHQVVVEELVWFPYLSILGLTVGMAWLVVVCCAAFTTCAALGSNYETIALYGTVAIATIAVDVTAYFMTKIDYTQTTAELISIDLVFAGGVLFYISTAMLLLFGAVV